MRENHQPAAGAGFVLRGRSAAGIRPTQRQRGDKILSLTGVYNQRLDLADPSAGRVDRANIPDKSRPGTVVVISGVCADDTFIALTFSALGAGPEYRAQDTGSLGFAAVELYLTSPTGAADVYASSDAIMRLNPRNDDGSIEGAFCGRHGSIRVNARW